MKTKGIVTGIVSNLVTVLVDGPVAENELCRPAASAFFVRAAICFFTHFTLLTARSINSSFDLPKLYFLCDGEVAV